MIAECGPTRIVALDCGKFEFAEGEIGTPAHLIGPNNVGKTSLIALLQFLYLDDQRQMQFARELAETRRYYFPGPSSYALFECLTPTGFQVVGVRGLGPLRQHEFERFAYAGRLDLDDYLDEERRVRPPEETLALLAPKGFARLDPRHLRAALTGSGDSKGVDLGLVPCRDTGAYDRFRKVFTNILRLAHIRQDELKRLLLDIYGPEFQKPSIDLAREYSSQLDLVRRDTHEVKELRDLQADIGQLLKHIERRDRARTVIPALWARIGEEYTARRGEIDRLAAEKRRELERVAADREEAREHLGAARREQIEHAGTLSLVRDRLSRLEDQRREFEGLEPSWASQRLKTLGARFEELVVLLRDAVADPPERVRAELEATRRLLDRLRKQLDDLDQAVVTLLRRDHDDTDLADAFSAIRPEILGLPVNTDAPGVRASDDSAPASLVRELLGFREGRRVEIRGVGLDLDALPVPDLARYHDPERIRQDIVALERQAERQETIIDAAARAEDLRKEKEGIDKERETLHQQLAGYDAFQKDLANEGAWREEERSLMERQAEIDARIQNLETRDTSLAETVRAGQAMLGAWERDREALTRQIQELTKPDSEWTAAAEVSLPEGWEGLLAHYRTSCAEEANQAERVQEILAGIGRRTYDRYTRDDEAATVQALREQAESIPEREKALQEMWKSIAVGIRKDLQSLGRDLDTLKAKVTGLNRRLAAVQVSNLASLRLEVEEHAQWMVRIRNVIVEDELPLFGDPRKADQAMQEIGDLLSTHPKIELNDLFDLSFQIGTPDGGVVRHRHLHAIESNGTTMAIKVLVNLVLLRDLLGDADVRIPFYLDECSSLDHANLASIVGAARSMGFIAILASPEAMDAADTLYYLTEEADGRVVLDPRTAMVRVERPAPAPEPAETE